MGELTIYNLYPNNSLTISPINTLNLGGKGEQERGAVVGSVVDLGCGVNGFSYKYLLDVLDDVDYVGVEASGQLAEHMNKYFDKENFSARVVVGDLFDIEAVMKILKNATKPRVVLCFRLLMLWKIWRGIFLRSLFWRF